MNKLTARSVFLYPDLAVHLAFGGAETALALVLDVVHSADRFAGVGRAVGALALVAPVGVRRAQTVVRARFRAAQIGVI